MIAQLLRSIKLLPNQPANYVPVRCSGMSAGAFGDQMRARAANLSIPKGFSLCEVVIAIGIFTFVMTTLMGLMPVALHSARTSLDISAATQLADGLATQLSQTNFTNLASVVASGPFYYDDGGKLLASPEGGIYKADLIITNSEASTNLARVQICVRRVQDPSSSRSFCYLLFNQDS